MYDTLEVRDQMQADTDAGLFAYMIDHADDRTWTQFTATLLAR